MTFLSTHAVRLGLLAALACGPVLAQETLELPIASANDDVEEFVGENPVGPAGVVYLDSSDLELVEDVGTTQVVGLRFALPFEPGAQIAAAYVQFTVDEPSEGDARLELRAEASDDAAAFTGEQNGVSSRTTGSAVVTWSPPAWPTPGQADEAQRSPDLAPLLQEVLERPGWASGNAVALLISGSGQRVAESYESSPAQAPRLVVVLASDADPQEPAPATPVETGTEGADMEDADSVDADTEGAEPQNAGAEDGAEEAATDETAGDDPTSAPALETGVTRLQERRYALEPLAGNATASLLVREYASGAVVLTLLLGDGAEGRGALLQTGSCEAPGEAVLRLEPTGPGGLSVTASTLEFARLAAGDLVLSLFERPDASGPALACGALD